MNINRNNYEEYFLLYADNELSKTERKVVEIFVQENADLKEEFLMIQLTLSAPDEEVKLLDKTFLIKKEPPFINENNYEEAFVSYHDNELSNQQKIETEQFVKDHPNFNIDFELIEKSKLNPDENIVFPDKKVLYRKEKSGRVIPLILWRSMAAAVFIGFGLWMTVSYFNQQQGIKAVALEGKTIKSLITIEPKTILEGKNNKENTAISSATKTGVNEKQNVAEKNNKPQLKTVPENNENKNAVVKKDEKIKTITEEQPAEARQENSNQLIAANIPVKNLSDKIEGTKSPVSGSEVIQHIDKYDETIQPQTQVEGASYAADNNNANNENYVFYNVKTEEFNKSKVGGFLKKVKRIVERSNPITRLLSGDDKQVASN